MFAVALAFGGLLAVFGVVVERDEGVAIGVRIGSRFGADG